MIYPFTVVNITKLQDELINKGIKFKQYITAETVNDYGVAENAWCEFSEGTDMKLVQQVIETHDPTPLPTFPTLEEQLAEKDAQILKLKEEQFKTQQMTIQNTETQQELIELLMMMGVI